MRLRHQLVTKVIVKLISERRERSQGVALCGNGLHKYLKYRRHSWSSAGSQHEAQSGQSLGQRLCTRAREDSGEQEPTRSSSVVDEDESWVNTANANPKKKD